MISSACLTKKRCPWSRRSACSPAATSKKVAIARGLMTRPKVLILDEPTRGVDVGAKKEIYQLINQFKADGLSIILVSSEMPEVLGMSDRIIVMHEGHLGGEFTREQATQEVLMAAAVGKLNRVNQE